MSSVLHRARVRSSSASPRLASSGRTIGPAAHGHAARQRPSCAGSSREAATRSTSTRTFALALALAFPLFCGASAAAAFQPPPPPARYATDTAGFISPQTRAALDQRLERYHRDTGHQVVLFIGTSTGDVPIEEWAARTFEAWGIGKKGKDDGVGIFVFSEDRKMRIEVGYGLEDVVPDAIANRIIQEQAIPRLKAGNPDDAVTATVNALLARIGGETSPPPQVAPIAATTNTAQPVSTAQIIFWAIILGIFLFILIRNPRLAWFLLWSMGSGGGSRRSGGGGWGGGGGGGGGFSGGGGRSGGGGATGSW